MSRILVVEDSADLAEGVAENLRFEGYDVRIASDGPQGLALAREWPADLVILDLMLPIMDGYEVLRTLRAGGSRVPVIILSARAEEADKIRGFRLDADQYVTKPFGVLELLERVRSLLRRSVLDTDDAQAIRFGAIEVDLASRLVTRAGQPCGLSPKAYTLLLALVRRDGAVVSRAELLREVWGYDEQVLSRTVDSHIAELRRKLEDDPATPRHIVTVWTIGYRFAR
jgi:two-component system, OmpR family, alkaline phosphatase synthesis response regulator PhoP